MTTPSAWALALTTAVGQRFAQHMRRHGAGRCVDEHNAMLLAAQTSTETAGTVRSCIKKTWNTKRERQYAHIEEGLLQRGKPKPLTEEIAAHLVNKERAPLEKALRR